MRKAELIFSMALISLTFAGCGDITVNKPGKPVVVEQPVIIEKKTIVEKPVVIEQRTVVEKPIVIEKTVVEKPVIVEKKTIVIDKR